MIASPILLSRSAFGRHSPVLLDPMRVLRAIVVLLTCLLANGFLLAGTADAANESGVLLQNVSPVRSGWYWDEGAARSAIQSWLDNGYPYPNGTWNGSCAPKGWYSIGGQPWNPLIPEAPGYTLYTADEVCHPNNGDPDSTFNPVDTETYFCGGDYVWQKDDPITGPGCKKGYRLAAKNNPDPKGKCGCDGQVVPGDPVDAGTGNMYLREPDFVAADPRMQFTRVYNSNGFSQAQSTVGNGWQGELDELHVLSMEQGLPAIAQTYVEMSRVYSNASDACTQGWSEIATGGGVSANADPRWAGVTASYDGAGHCNLSNGQSLPVLGTGQQIGISGSTDSAQRLITLLRGNGAKYWMYCTQGVCQGTGALAKVNMTVDTTGYTVHDRQGNTERYNIRGFLTTLTWKDGYQQSFVYNNDNDGYGQLSDGMGSPLSVTDNHGRAMTFGYDANGMLSTLTTPDGVVHYAHDAHGRLTSVTYPTGYSRTYHYDDTANPNAITSLVDENGATLTTWTYDSFGRATDVVQSGGVGHYTFAFNVDGTRTFTDPLLTSRTLTFQSPFGFQQLLHVAGAVCDVCGNGQTNTYQANGTLATQTDWNGKVTATTYDANGLLDDLVEAQGSDVQRSTHIDWDTTLRNPTQTTVANLSGTFLAKTNWTYNARGEPLTITRTDPAATTNTRTWTATYCEAADITAGVCPLLGLVKTIDGPRTDVSDITTYTYYANDDGGCPATCTHRKGDLWKVTDALGHVTTFTKYDGSGRLLSITDVNGVVTDYSYGSRGWLTQVAVRGTNDAVTSDDVITGYTYDPAGQLTRLTQADGSYYGLTWDGAHRLTDIAWKDASNNLAASIHYTLDAMGNRTQEDTFDASSPTVPKRSLKRTFNALGQLATTLNADHTTVNGTYGYDANGNPTSVTNGRGYVTQYSVDALNRVYQIAQDPGDSTHVNAYTGLTLDVLDRTTQVNDPHGLPTSYQYDGLGNLKQLGSPDTGTAYSSYDAAGNQISRQDARNVTATYTYDVLNRLTGIVYPTTALNVSIGYDTLESGCPALGTFPVGKMTHFTDGSGTTLFCYDRFGRVVRKFVYVLTAMYTTADNSFDKMGRPTNITLPRGTHVYYTYDGVGRIIGVNYQLSSQSSQHVLVSNVTYYPFGPVASITYGSGVGARTVTYAYDADYVIGGVHDSASGGLNLTFLRDTIGNLTRVTSTTASSNFGYDPLDRLKRVGDALSSDAQLAAFTYDATGNRLTKQAASGSPLSNYTYPNTSHRLLSTGPTGNVITRGYDAMGNTTSIGSLNFTYDDTGRMSVVKNGSTQLRQYSYNARGERTRKSHTGFVNDTQKMIYDENGHLLGDFDNGNNIIDEYIWMDDRPVGVVVGTGTTVDYVESDHLGTPRAVIDPTPNTAVWSWALTGDPFGESTPNQDPDADGTNFTFNLRFPGQTYDAESGLSNNYFRDFDSGAGRLVQSDPIGLYGGISTYSYAKSNTLALVDPSGLDPHDFYGSREDAASDYANFVYSHSFGERPEFEPNQEVSNWLVPSPNGLCWSYSGDFGKGPIGGGENDHAPMPPRPSDGAVGIHTHTILAQTQEYRIEASGKDLMRTTSSYGLTGNQFVVGVMKSSQSYPNIYGGVSFRGEIWVSEYEKKKMTQHFKAGHPSKVDKAVCGCTK